MTLLQTRCSIQRKARMPQFHVSRCFTTSSPVHDAGMGKAHDRGTYIGVIPWLEESHTDAHLPGFPQASLRQSTKAAVDWVVGGFVLQQLHQFLEHILELRSQCSETLFWSYVEGIHGVEDRRGPLWSPLRWQVHVERHPVSVSNIWPRKPASQGHMLEGQGRVGKTSSCFTCESIVLSNEAS